MRHTKHDIRNAKYKPGFSLAELLISLAITAILLVAVAIAFNASVINYSENEDIFRTINNARQALFRITSQLRTADAVDPDPAINQCSLITADGDDITYQYNSGNSTLYLIDNTSGDSYKLCDNVTAMTFTKNTDVDGSVTYVKSVQISITVASGEAQRTVAAAAVVRRNLK
jgi:prepilin-type N-terminal cleavage/methylation domain-containing protein